MDWHHPHSELYHALHSRCHFDLGSTEFLYHLLTGDPQLRRALYEGLRDHVGLRGAALHPHTAGLFDHLVNLLLGQPNATMVRLATYAIDIKDVYLRPDPPPHPLTLRPRCASLIEHGRLGRCFARSHLYV